ncbi:putative eukaryotic translation initiation factor 5 [Cryptosporidium felis]|nr:putative eukaryotic translation initiation factor 5 [Cryptosporidium felis]
MLNIPSTVDDPNYRYKMPKLVSKIEGRGNGIRTKIVNMAEIARSLKRPPAYPTKFFGCELGALSKWEDKEEKSIVNGAHQQNDLQRLMDKFIQMYVLCPNCELPEIDIIVKKERVNCKCNACGYIGALDNNHKITTYISKNPPGGIESTMGTRNKKERKDKERDKERNLDGCNGPIGEHDKSCRHRSKKTNKRNGKKSVCDESLLEKDVLTFDSPEITDVIERLSNYISRNEKMTPEDFFSELRVLQVSQDFDEYMRFTVSLVVLFGLKDPVDPKVFKHWIPYISKVVEGSLKSNAIISIFETYCVERNPDTLITYPYLMQQLYDADILSEKAILKYYQKDTPAAWGSSCTAQNTFEKAKKSCEPFIKWLLDGSNDGSDRSDDNDYDTISSDADEFESPSPMKSSHIKVKSLNLSEQVDADRLESSSDSEGENSPAKNVGISSSQSSGSDLDIDNI